MTYNQYIIDSLNTPNLVGFWAMNNNHEETLQDLGALRNNGSILGATFKGGRGEGHLDHDGIDDRGDITNKDEYTPTSNGFTCSAWILARSIQSGVGQFRIPALAKSGGGSSPAGNVWEWFLYSTRSGTDRWVFLTLTPTGAVLSQAIDPDTLSLNQTYFLVGTTDENGATQLYVDGVLKATGANAALPQNNSANVFIGFHVGSTVNWYLDGKCYEVRMYNRQLKDAEIKQSYEMGRRFYY